MDNYVMKFDEFLTEAKRAKDGRFKNLDRILSGNYNDLSRADRNVKDSLFNSYRRYFNDGEAKFSTDSLERVGCSNETIGILTNPLNFDVNKEYGKKYEAAMEQAMEDTFRYFVKNYPKLFSSENRNS